MRRPAIIAVFLALVLSCMPLLSNNAFPHGDAPSTCENRYDADITSMTISNGAQTFDPIADPDLMVDAQIGEGYDVTFMLHTANVSSQNNTGAGTTWYRNMAFGFGQGVCVDNAGPDQDIGLTVHVDVMPGVPDGYTQNGVEWGAWPGTSQIRYNVVWHSAAEPEPPAKEPPAEQPPQQDTTEDDEPPAPPVPDEDEAEVSDDNELKEEEFEENDSTGTMISPFVFKDKTTTASVTEEDDEVEEQLPQIADGLYLNGTIASYYLLNGTEFYILSGNWSMAVNETAVFDFGANFTTVRANGLDRQAFSIDNMTAVNASDVIFEGGTAALTSQLDYHADGTTTKVNATITMARLNVVKIELENLDAPMYGVVDKIMQVENGETRVVERQFDMI